MKKIIVGILFLVCVFQSSAFAKPVKRLKFAGGATQMVVTGRLSSYKDELRYVIRLRKGQRLKISSDQYVTLGIVDPAGNDPMDYAADCHSRADISPTLAGDYKIGVVECNKADAWRGVFKLKISAR